MAGTGLEALGRETDAGVVTKAEELARRVVGQCLARGVAEFVLCPGSRNSPLLAEALRAQVKCWGHMDERAAGFFALGRCRALERPVAVITTSGTAAFELFPAVIEALYQRLPLLAITADRPKRYRGTGAPQAIEQAGMFCVYAVWNRDTEDGRLDFDAWDGWGPAHVNVCLDEPLLGGADRGQTHGHSLPAEAGEVRPVPSEGRRRRLSAPDAVLLGSLHPGDRGKVRDFLKELQRPILAEATSGLREDESLQQWMLRDGEHSFRGAAMGAVIRIGGLPSGRFWRDLEERREVNVYSVLANGFRGLARDTLMFDSLDQLEFDGRASVIDLEASRRRAARLEELLQEYPSSEPALVRALSRVAGAGASVFLGNSLPIREWNLAASYGLRCLDCWANRGANGIDGNLSTWLGWSAGNGGESWGIFGDLTALYDLNSLWTQDQLQPARRRIVILNNLGAGIFRRIPDLAAAKGDFGRFVFSGHGIGFRSWAEMWGCEYRCWEGGTNGFDEAGPGTSVCEIRPDPVETEAFWTAWNRVRVGEAES